MKAFSGDMGVIGVVLALFDVRNKRHIVFGTIQKNLNAPRTVAHTYAKWT